MKRLAVLFSLFILLIIILADAGLLSRLLGFVNRIPFFDKAGHFILYGILALLINLAVFGTRPVHERVPLLLRTGLVLGAFIGIEEFSQRYFSERSFDLVDLAFSYLGLVVFSWVALKTNAGQDRSRPA
jgi:polysaccharide biosynthesis protein VpsQ